MTWVGPGVGVVEVQQQGHIQSVDAPGQRQGFVSAIVAAGGIHPDAQAYAVDAVGGEDSQGILRRAVGMEPGPGRF